jgi:flagellar protein FlbD
VIVVTGLGGDPLVVNADLIVTIEQTPDTVITLVNGDKLIVRESPQQLVTQSIEYRRRGGMFDLPDVRRLPEAVDGR